MSQRAPGYRFQYQVPPTSPAASNTLVDMPSCRRRYSRYNPEKPAPTTTTSTSSGPALDPLPAAVIRLLLARRRPWSDPTRVFSLPLGAPPGDSLEEQPDGFLVQSRLPPADALLDE